MDVSTMSGFQDLNIRPFLDQYKISNFIETGCHTGSGIRHAVINGIQNIYSCDIDKKFVDICHQQFPNAIIMHSHSVDFLNGIVEIIPGNCLFWLDAHFPELTGGTSKNEEERFPLFKELEILSKKSDIENDVILVDDIRVIISEDNPIKQDFDDQYKIYGTSIKDLTDLFPKHKAEILNFQEGLLLFTPK
jgi:hypothetical protein